MKNLLLDRRFQLKFTGYSVLMAVLAAALLGVFLYTTSKDVLQQASNAVRSRSVAAEQSRDLGNATLSNELYSHLNDPQFAKELKQRAGVIDKRYEMEKDEIIRQRADLEQSQRRTWLSLSAGLLTFVLFVTMFSIVATHRIAGPAFRIRRMVEDVAQGRLAMPKGKLRDRDELQELFTSVLQMVASLHQHDARLLAVLEQLEAGATLEEPVGSQVAALAKTLRGRLQG